MRNVVITGANRGIGLAMVRAFAKQKDAVIACARARSEEFEQELQRIAQEEQVEITPIYFDLSCSEEVKRGIKEILSKQKKIDVLVNNAAVAHAGLLSMTSIETIRKVYDVNVFAQLQLIQGIAKSMMRYRSGCIINLASVGGIEANPGYIAYGSSKAAMIWITRCLSRELGTYHIRVNAIAPGLIDTQMGHYKKEEELEKVLQRTTLSRMGTPEEIAKAACYLASEDAAYMTGHIMVLDGGRV